MTHARRGRAFSRLAAPRTYWGQAGLRGGYREAGGGPRLTGGPQDLSQETVGGATGEAGPGAPPMEGYLYKRASNAFRTWSRYPNPPAPPKAPPAPHSSPVPPNPP